MSIQSAAQRLVGEHRPCHLIWDPLTGEIVQLISILRAGRALGAPEQLDWGPNRVPAAPQNVNTEGRICVQVGVLAHPADPFTSGPLAGLGPIVSWLDSWNVPRCWPAGQPAAYCVAGLDRGREDAARSRVLWARGGHFGASQIPGCDNIGPGGIDIDRLTGAHVVQVHPRELPAHLAPATALPIPA